VFTFNEFAMPSAPSELILHSIELDYFLKEQKKLPIFKYLTVWLDFNALAIDKTSSLVTGSE
jgi:hypothetical protein